MYNIHADYSLKTCSMLRECWLTLSQQIISYIVV